MNGKSPEPITERRKISGKLDTPPYLVAFEYTFECKFHFQSMEVEMFRDDKRVDDLGLYSFYLEIRGNGTYVKFQYNDTNPTTGHKYMLDVTMHFLVPKGK